MYPVFGRSYRKMRYRAPRLPNMPYRTPTGVVPGPDYPINWPEIRKWVLQRDGHQCTNTWQDAYGNWNRCPNIDHLHVDHVIPKSKGGTDTADNLRTLCERCHSSRHPHMMQQYVQNHPEEFGVQPQAYPYYPYAYPYGYPQYQYGYG